VVSGVVSSRTASLSSALRSAWPASPAPPQVPRPRAGGASPAPLPVPLRWARS